MFVKFSSCSTDIMGRTIASKGSCFVEREQPCHTDGVAFYYHITTLSCVCAEPLQQECGNGIVEGDEECDCGSTNEEECMSYDPCCLPGECLLREGAECRFTDTLSLRAISQTLCTLMLFTVQTKVRAVQTALLFSTRSISVFRVMSA